MCKSAACLGGFSLTKAPSFAIRNSDCKIHPQRRLNDKSFSSSAELDQQALPAGHPLPFEKEAKPRLHKLGAARQRVGFRTKPIRELGAGSACRESVFLCFLSFFLKRKEVRAEPARGGQLFSWPPLVWDALWDLGKSVFTLCVGALLWDADGVDHLVILLLHLGFGSDAGQLHRLQRLIDAV